MINETKIEIKNLLQVYIDVKCKGSQTAAANKLRDISGGTISQVLNDNWELIADGMWWRIAKQTGYKQDWQIAKTSVYNKLFSYAGDSQRSPSGIRALVVSSSLGKSISLEKYVDINTNAYHVRCHRHMPIKILLRDMLKAMGKDSTGSTVEMLDSIERYVQRENEPLFFIDEVDKLKDEILEMFVDIENKLHGKCGIVFLATPYLRKRIEAGVARGKRGFAELHSRIRKVYWDLTPNRIEFSNDCALICIANGIDDEARIIEFANKCDNDFRVLSDLIKAFKNL